MKQFLILSITLALVFSVTCELNYLPEEIIEEEPKTFLQVGEDKGKIIIVPNCEGNNTFINNKTKVFPLVVTKGEKINIKVQGKSGVEIALSKITVVASLNGTQAFTDTKSMEGQKVAATQDFVYDYETTVPTFIPEGRFDIKIYLVNTAGDKVSCLDAYFDF